MEHDTHCLNRTTAEHLRQAWRLSCEQYGIDLKRPLHWVKVPAQKLQVPESH